MTHLLFEAVISVYFIMCDVYDII